MRTSPCRSIPAFCLLLLMLAEVSTAKAIVFPFQVHTLEKKNHQWLGRAISFYRASGLELNSIGTIKDPEIHSILNNRDIPFPYVISKATCIKLAIISGADQIIWGEVESSGNPQTHNVQIKTYIIDMKNLSQKYLPLLKFHLIDFYAVQRELLKMVLDYFQKEQPRFPELNLDYHHYEMFIKSLLLENNKEKLGLLEQVSRDISNSDYLNFELAKCHLCLGNISAASHFLEKITDGESFRYDREFIRGLVFYHNNQLSRASELFSKLQRLNVFLPEATNNLGILFRKAHPPALSESFFVQSIRSRKDPEVYLNYIKLLIESGKNRLARENLKQALIFFPDDEDLIKLFGYFLSQEKNQEHLFSVFQNYIPQLILTENCPALEYKIKNPFELQTTGLYRPPNDIESTTEDFLKGDINQRLDRIRDSMELNPFVPKLHQMLSQIYLKKNNRPLSKRYQLTAAFLKPDRKASDNTPRP